MSMDNISPATPSSNRGSNLAPNVASNRAPSAAPNQASSPVVKPTSNPAPKVSEADQARADLYDTLSQLRDRLDYAQRIDDRVELAKRGIAQQKQENPWAFAAGVAVVAVGAGFAAWAVTRKIIELFK